jgi:hypothetical protein
VTSLIRIKQGKIKQQLRQNGGNIFNCIRYIVISDVYVWRIKKDSKEEIVVL